MPLIKLLKFSYVIRQTKKGVKHFKAASYYTKNTCKWCHKHNDEMRKISPTALVILGSKYFIFHVAVVIYMQL